IFEMPPLVRTVDVSKRYSSGEAVIAAVSNVSLSIAVGEFVAIRGRSGSGKSTLMNLLGLLDQPDSGEYALKGRDVAQLSERARADQELRQRLGVPIDGASPARDRAGKCRVASRLRFRAAPETPP